MLSFTCLVRKQQDYIGLTEKAMLSLRESDLKSTSGT